MSAMFHEFINSLPLLLLRHDKKTKTNLQGFTIEMTVVSTGGAKLMRWF